MILSPTVGTDALPGRRYLFFWRCNSPGNTQAGRLVARMVLPQASPQEMIALVPIGAAPVFVVDETSRNVEAVDYQRRGWSVGD